MTTVVGLFETRDAADRAIEALKAAGFGAEHLDVVAREPSLAADVGRDIRAHEGAAGAVLGGGIVGGVTGLLVGVAATAIPGVGAALAAGPIAGALAGTAVGGMIGALTGHGVPHEHADSYTAALERGAILLTVQASDDRAAEARRVLAANGSFDAESRAVAASREADESDRGPRLTARAVGEPIGSPGVGVGSVAGFAVGDSGPSLTYREAEPHFRHHWESTRGPSDPAPFEGVSHAYRYGWESYENPEDYGKSWEQISGRLAAGWPGNGPWDEHAPLVRQGWESRSRG
jgi:hypothetical protein